MSDPSGPAAGAGGNDPSAAPPGDRTPEMPVGDLPGGPIHRSWPEAPVAQPMVPGQAIPAPSGSVAPLEWKVKRRWIPRLGADTLWARFRRRFRKTFRRAGDAADAGDGCLDVGDGVVAAIALIIIGLVLIFVILPALVAIVDVVILLVLALGGLVARVLFRRPWLIDARDGTGRVLRWRVVGWKASAQRVDDVRHLLADGIVPADAEIFRDPAIDDD
ncbi:MAG: hypothetical protein ACTHN0_01125 [Aquihabitans sp.]